MLVPNAIERYRIGDRSAGLVTDPDGVLRDIFEFVGVDPAYPVDSSIHRNASAYEPKHRGVDRVARSGIVRTTARLLPRRTRVRARGYLRDKNSVVPELPDAVRARLLDLYRDDIGRTADLIGRDLSGWLA